jgi:POT family proton-dependent oligopeptide transporter
MSAPQSEWFGQPRGLTILFLTAMWELFAYYGMRTILVYYMVKQLLMGQERASLVYGLYTAFTYFTPLIGGFMADRWLGRYRAVLSGAAIMAAGLFMMASAQLFYAALATIIVGYGLFLTPVPSQIAGLYAADDPRRHSAYNFWYVGLNVGALFAPVACGTVGELYGWNWGFSVAGVGMLIGLTVYIFGRRYLPPDPSPAERRARSRLEAISGAKLAGRKRLGRFVLLAAIAAVIVIFRAAYEQLGNTVPLWIETTERSAHGFDIPMTWFQSLDPLLVITMAPFLAWYWLRLARSEREPASISKMSFGATIIAASYLMIAIVTAGCAARGIQVSFLWVIAFYVVLTFGEINILPVGVGLFARLAPSGYGATTIALWYFANFFGNLAAGALGTRWSHLSSARFFIVTAAVAGISAILLKLFSGRVRDAMAEQ